jgi:hypothetical protein
MTDVTQDMDQDTVELWAANESSFRGKLTKRAREGRTEAWSSVRTVTLPLGL